jgi:glucose/arabinose dehydrogenase
MKVLARAFHRLSAPGIRKTPRRRFLCLEPLEDRYLLSSGVPFTIGGDSRVHPSDFRLTAFATGLNFPTAMVQLSDGSLLATNSVPVQSSFFNSTGQLVRLVDANQDGIADGPGTVLASGLPGTLTALRQGGNLFFATSSAAGSERILVLRAGATPADSLSLLGSLNFSFPLPNWEHTTYELAVRPTPGQSGDYDLFFNIGSPANQSSTDLQVALSGLATGSLNDDSIYKITVHDTGGTPQFSNLTQIATGLRNAAGMAFSPNSRDFYFQDNGIDGGGNPEEELSADELNHITLSNTGAIADFGFPSTYIDYNTGQKVGTQGLAPTVAFVPGSGGEIAGAVKVSFAPAGNPAGLNDGIFVGFHGIFNGGGTANDENPVAYVDLHTRTFFRFIAPGQPGVGHLNGLLATQSALFVADMSTNGDVFNSTHTGAIYQIQSLHGVITARGTTFHPREGVAFTGAVATFTETNLSEGAGSFTATIDWGDGATTAGMVTAMATPGRFQVTGTHTYAEESGATPVPVAVTITDGGATATAHSAAAVADAALVAHFRSFNPVAGTPFNAQVASFIDRDPGGVLSDYMATIDWGDGTTSAGTIAASSSGFTVNGGHTYAAPGTFAVVVVIQDAGGSAATVRGTITVGAAPMGRLAEHRGGDAAAIQALLFSNWGRQFDPENPLWVTRQR